MHSHIDLMSKVESALRYFCVTNRAQNHRPVFHHKCSLIRFTWLDCPSRRWRYFHRDAELFTKS